MLPTLLATATDSSDFVSLLLKGGPTAVLVAVVIGFVRGWIVPGSSYAEACSQRDRAIEVVYKMADTTQRAAEVVSRQEAGG